MCSHAACCQTLREHIRRRSRRKHVVQPARARANNASCHGKHADMWLGDRRGGSDKRDRERLQSCGPSIMCNVYAIVVYPSQRVQLQVEVAEQDYLRQSKASVANGKTCFTCPNLRRAVEQGCASCASQTLKAASGHLLPNANQVVAARSGASGPRQRTLNHPHGHHDGAKAAEAALLLLDLRPSRSTAELRVLAAFGRATTLVPCP